MTKDHSQFTYEDLARFILEELTPEQQKQKIQIAHTQPDQEKPLFLHSFVCMETVGKLGFDKVHPQVVDNLDGKCHPEHVVIYTDWCWFGADGSIGFDLMTGEKIFPKGAKS